MRLIDADELLKSEIKRCGCVPLVGSCTNDNKILKEVISEAPTIPTNMEEKRDIIRRINQASFYTDINGKQYRVVSYDEIMEFIRGE